MQSFLAGRKVCTSGDLRTNLYLLALASSGTGKEFPRKVNSHILYRVGLAGALGDKFASGEGIQDTLLRSGMMLFQNDEMDGVLRQINSDHDNRRESIPNILLTLYTSASDIYPTRVKAGQRDVVHIDQPHLTLFGTATPQFFYESLSRRMLTNGFFARLSIVDVGSRGPGQGPRSVREVPDSVIATAQWWADFQPGHGNLQNFHPEPRAVPLDPDAAEAVEQLRKLTEAEYQAAEQASDEVARTAWSRTCEHANKLALKSWFRERQGDERRIKIQRPAGRRAALELQGPSCPTGPLPCVVIPLARWPPSPLPVHGNQNSNVTVHREPVESITPRLDELQQLALDLAPRLIRILEHERLTRRGRAYADILVRCSPNEAAPVHRRRPRLFMHLEFDRASICEIIAGIAESVDLLGSEVE